MAKASRLANGRMLRERGMLQRLDRDRRAASSGRQLDRNSDEPFLKSLMIAGALLAALAVAAGAFGAHALAARLSPERLATWETAARYHMYGALSVVLVALALSRFPSSLLSAAGWVLVTGTVVFGGTVYMLALGGPRWLGAITPLGGLALIAGWVLVAVAVWKAA
jgi:uncharacterized membrane protein YgdD (TMEM256/DUF423 family)